MLVGMTHWTPTRAEGLARLQAFLPRAGRSYASNRNSDLGPQDRSNVSTLSPWLRRRLLSEEEVARAVLGRHSLTAAAKFIQEICWRTYWKGWLEMRPSVWTDYNADLAALRAELEDQPGLAERVAEAEAGRSGLAPFDAWARELVETGYLHNHARMWFASIWIYTLGLPWELGADFFLRHLLDGDPASNTLSWRWVAGLHTRGKTYLARADNINRHTNGRFELQPSALAQTAPPLEGRPNPERGPLPAGDPFPHEPFVLLLTDEDLDPFGADPRMQSALAIGAASFVDHLTPAGVAPPVSAFAKAARDEALARFGSATGPPTTVLEAADETSLAAWAASAGVAHIVTPYVPVGPARSALDALAPGLETRGVTLSRIRRGWDEAFWPHATAGFFKLRAQIPTVLAELGFSVDPADDGAFAGVSSGRRKV